MYASLLFCAKNHLRRVLQKQKNICRAAFQTQQIRKSPERVVSDFEALDFFAAVKYDDFMSKRSNRNRKNQNRGRQKTPINALNAKAEFHRHIFADVESEKKKELAIAELKNRVFVCPLCGKNIEDATSAIVDKQSGQPAHFDCVMSEITKREMLSETQKIAYIGAGRFGVISYANPKEVKTFKIEKIIEWENRDAEQPWRSEMSALYSQIL